MERFAIEDQCEQGLSLLLVKGEACRASLVPELKQFAVRSAGQEELLTLVQ
ncbi:hypothetical protein DFAR_2820004 [Desulfarculales bacterium]